MYVGSIMRTHLITVSPETSLSDAMKILKEKKISHLLVVDGKGKLVGIVSDRDVKQNWASPATTLSTHELNYLLAKITVGMIMIRNLVVVSPQTTIERAALNMQENRINCLPVMDGDKLVGIITSTDVMGVLLTAIGIDKESTRFTVLVADRVGAMAEITRILKDNDINIRSMFAWPDPQYPGVYQLVMRVPQRDGSKAIQSLTAAGLNVLTSYVADLKPYLPV